MLIAMTFHLGWVGLLFILIFALTHNVDFWLSSYVSSCSDINSVNCYHRKVFTLSTAQFLIELSNLPKPPPPSARYVLITVSYSLLTTYFICEAVFTNRASHCFHKAASNAFSNRLSRSPTAFSFTQQNPISPVQMQWPWSLASEVKRSEWKVTQFPRKTLLGKSERAETWPDKC